MRFFLIFSLSFFADQSSKFWIRLFLDRNESICIIPHFFSLTYLVNRNIFFGLLLVNLYLIIFVHFMVILFLLWLWRKLFFVNKRGSGAVGLIIGGLAGNLFDRIWQNGVIDFLDLTIWPVFNVADVLIVVGGGIILWEILKFSPKR